MSKYTSQGTIRVRCAFSERSTGTQLFFVPDVDHSIKHGDDTSAVFVPLSEGDAEPLSDGKAVIRKYDRNSNGVEIVVKEIISVIAKDPSGDNECRVDVVNAVVFGVISAAATHQTKVEVEVEEKNGNDSSSKLELTGIRVLAQ